MTLPLRDRILIAAAVAAVVGPHARITRIAPLLRQAPLRLVRKPKEQKQRKTEGDSK